MGGADSIHPDMLLARLTARQMQEWLAFLDHFGGPRLRGDLWSAVVAHASAAPHVRRKLGIADFMPKWGRQVRRRSTAEMRRDAEAWAMRAKRRQVNPASVGPPSGPPPAGA